MKKFIISVVGFISAVLFIVLMALSFKNVDHDQFAIKYHKVSRNIAGGVYEQGKHYVQPGEVMFKYKRRFVTIDFTTSQNSTITTFTSDGLEAVLSLSVQYQLQRDHLHDVLHDFGREVHIENFIRTIARDSIRKVASRFTGEEMFTARGAIEVALLETVEADFQNAGTYAQAGFVQLENIALPSGFETAINEKQAAEQDKEKAENERQGRLVVAETELQLAIRDAAIKLIDADAKGKGKIKIAEQEALSIKKTWEERANAYKNVMDSLGITADEFVRGYLASAKVQQTSNAVIGID